MAWNEPGGKSGKEPPNNPWGKNREPGPPDLEQILKKWIEKFKSILNQKGKKESSGFGKDQVFGGNGNGGNGNTGNNGFGNNSSGSGMGRGIFSEQKDAKPLLMLVGIVLVVLYTLAGIYIVEPPESAVITRFGRYVRTEGPGPHWLPVFFESREIVNVEQVATSDHSGLMLTKDRNIAQVGVAVQYRIGDGPDDVKAFLFNVVNPIHSLKQSAESALRQVVGQYTMDEVLTLKRSEIAVAIKDQIIETLKNYHTGIMVLDVAMQFAKPPDEVRAAFDDVIRAAADEERLINQARSYENQVLPDARGTAERKKYEALAYKQETILKAQGDVQRFNLILPEYQKAPKVTQTRLYLDSMEEILSKVNKVISDAGPGNNFFFMPFEKIMKHNTSVSSNEAEIYREPASEKAEARDLSSASVSQPTSQQISQQEKSNSRRKSDWTKRREKN